MKIVYISTSHIPSKIANSIHVMNICSCFAAMGHEVTLICPILGDEPDNRTIFESYGLPETFTLKKLPFSNIKGRTMFFMWQVYKVLKKIKPDYVVGRFINGCYLSSKMGIPTTFDTHGPIWEAGKLSYWMFKQMLKQKSFRKLTFNSKALKEIYVKSGVFEEIGLADHKLIVANNGANIYDLGDKVNLPSRGANLKIGYFGHLYRVGRGIDSIVELARRLPKHDFYIVGGEAEDIEYWKKEAGVDNICFTGYVPFSDVYKYRNFCDVLLAPYQMVVSPEGKGGDQGAYMNPIKYLEYMSSMKAIIASDLISSREVLDETSAILVPYDKIDDWEQAIIRLDHDKELRYNIGANAYDKFLKDYTWIKRAEKLL